MCNAEKFQDKLLKFGREVSRKEALKVSREILERAEKERRPPEPTDDEIIDALDRIVDEHPELIKPADEELMKKADELTAPTDEEIRRVLAEKVMGWKYPARGKFYIDKDREPTYAIPGASFGVRWDPLRNIEQAMMCEGKIGEMLLIDKYINALKIILLTSYQQEPVCFNGESQFLYLYRFAHASADQRARACYAVMGKEE